MRIVSTVPSQTELLHYLGLDDSVVGITAYCVHPKSYLETKTVIGGTKNLNVAEIKRLSPDLVIANHEENIREQIEEIRSFTKVYVSQIESIEDALDMVLEVGRLTETAEKAKDLVTQIKNLRKQLENPNEPKRVLYFIWKEPYMVAGTKTFIGKMLEEAGLQNVAPVSKERYPTLSQQKIQELQPDLLLLSSEPFSFTTSHLHKMASNNPKAICKIVDGELFSWYGSRMLSAFKYLRVFQRNL